jgi:hypothetical protein
VGISAQRRERQPGFLRLKGEGIYFEDVEDIFAALLAGKIIVDPGQEGVASEFERVAAAIKAEGLGQLGAVFAGSAGQKVGASDAIDNVGDFNQGVIRVGVGLAQVARELVSSPLSEIES